MEKAEDKARSMGKGSMSLSVVGENAGAIRLYERLGFQTTRTLEGSVVGHRDRIKGGSPYGEIPVN